MTESPDETHVAVVLDRSGSMAAIADEVINGFNGFVADQAATPGVCRLTLVQFDTEKPFDVITDAVPIAEVAPFDHNSFQPRGGTPLYDAVANTIVRLDKRAEYRAGKDLPAEDVLVLIITDGHENSSTDWTREQVFDMITARQEQDWTFAFIGANQDAYAAGAEIGAAHGSSLQYEADSEGTSDMMSRTSLATSAWRSSSRSERRSAQDEFFTDDE
jgi:uncharacterized protein YegL